MAPLTMPSALAFLRPLARLRGVARRRDPRRLVYIACEACGRPVNLAESIEDVDGLLVCPACRSGDGSPGEVPRS